VELLFRSRYLRGPILRDCLWRGAIAWTSHLRSHLRGCHLRDPFAEPFCIESWLVCVEPIFRTTCVEPLFAWTHLRGAVLRSRYRGVSICVEPLFTGGWGYFGTYSNLFYQAIRWGRTSTERRAARSGMTSQGGRSGTRHQGSLV
jgi:hypothetical protein